MSRSAGRFRLLFAGAGVLKLIGDPRMLDLFTTIGAGQWLRYGIGACEVAGAVGVLVPRLAGLAAACPAVLMLGAVVTNVLIGASRALPVVLLLVAAVITYRHRASLLTTR